MYVLTVIVYVCFAGVCVLRVCVCLVLSVCLCLCVFSVCLVCVSSVCVLRV